MALADEIMDAVKRHVEREIKAKSSTIQRTDKPRHEVTVTMRGNKIVVHVSNWVGQPVGWIGTMIPSATIGS